MLTALLTLGAVFFPRIHPLPVKPQPFLNAYDVQGTSTSPVVQIDPLENRGVELEFGVLIEGDVRLVQKKISKATDMAAYGFAPAYTTSHQVRSSVADEEQLWTNRIIPYVLDLALNETEIHEIQLAMLSITEGSGQCVEFVTRTTEADFIFITHRGSGCWSEVGRKGGNQTISVSRASGCVTTGIVMHELLHALGFWHEHTRQDRNSYINLIPDNILFGHGADFNINSNAKILVQDYDYYSIMHYKTTAFSKDSARLKTFTILQSGVNESLVGQRKFLSGKDKQRIKILYGCDKSSRSTLLPESYFGSRVYDAAAPPPVTKQGNLAKSTRFVRDTYSSGSNSVDNTVTRPGQTLSTASQHTPSTPAVTSAEVTASAGASKITSSVKTASTSSVTSPITSPQPTASTKTTTKATPTEPEAPADEGLLQF